MEVPGGSGFRDESRVAMTPAESTIPSVPANKSFHVATAEDCRQFAVTPAPHVGGRLLCGMLTEVRAFRLYTRAVNCVPTILSSRWWNARMCCHPPPKSSECLPWTHEALSRTW